MKIIIVFKKYWTHPIFYIGVVYLCGRLSLNKLDEKIEKLEKTINKKIEKQKDKVQESAIKKKEVYNIV